MRRPALHHRRVFSALFVLALFVAGVQNPARGLVQRSGSLGASQEEEEEEDHGSELEADVQAALFPRKLRRSGHQPTGVEPALVRLSSPRVVWPPGAAAAPRRRPAFLCLRI